MDYKIVQKEGKISLIRENGSIIKNLEKAEVLSLMFGSDMSEAIDELNNTAESYSDNCIFFGDELRTLIAKPVDRLFSNMFKVSEKIDKGDKE